jgi:hypothetical protein
VPKKRINATYNKKNDPLISRIAFSELGGYRVFCQINDLSITWDFFKDVEGLKLTKLEPFHKPLTESSP